MICPGCFTAVADDDCDVELFPDPDIVGDDPEPGVVMRAGCPNCSTLFRASFGFPPNGGLWGHMLPGSPAVGDDDPVGVCLLCGDMVKRSVTRPFGRVAWTGWCPACHATSWRLRIPPSRPPQHDVIVAPVP